MEEPPSNAPRRTMSRIKRVIHKPSNKVLICRVSIELLALLVVLSPMAVVYVFLQGNVEPFHRGFYCNDENLKHPHLEDTVSIGGCVGIWMAIVIIVVPSIEVLFIYVFEKYENTQKIGFIPWTVVELYRVIGYYILGGVFSLLATETAKFTIGRLRPHFLTVCNFDYPEELCKDGEYYRFVTDYNCPNASDPHVVREARKSFLSGHSSFSFYSAVFLIVYLHARLSNSPTKQQFKVQIVFRGLKILRPFFQFSFFALAFYISLTRISDYKHHPTDVLTGAILGAFFAIMILVFLVNLFKRPTAFKESIIEEYYEAEAHDNDIRASPEIPLTSVENHSEPQNSSRSGYSKSRKNH